MICPLKVLGSFAYYGGYFGDKEVCSMKECAWWDGKQCAILAIATNLDKIRNAILTNK